MCPFSSVILVTGATGAVGPQIVSRLVKERYQVRTLSLDPPPEGIWSDSVEVRTGDVTNPAFVLEAMQGVDAVVHLAALLHIVNPPDSLRDHYRKINVGGTRTVVDAAVKANVRRLLFFSTIAVYGNTKGQIVDEQTQPHPDTYYARTKVDAEKIVLAAKNSARQPIGTVLRLGAVYGSRIKGNYRQLLIALERGRFLPIGKGRNRRTLIYDKDVANAAILALNHPAAGGRVYNVSDGHYHTLVEIITEMCKALGRKPPRFSIPAAPVRVTAGVLENAAKIIGFTFPLNRATIDKYLEDIAVDSRLIQTELGFKPQFDLAGGWQDAVQEMRCLKIL
jgi:UDP-glucose 4-epimerase